MKITRFQLERWITPEDRMRLVESGIRVEVVPDNYFDRRHQRRKSPASWMAYLRRLE
jgi:hypothetical protein